MALDLLFPYFDELVRAPEDVQRLNEAILQLAVQGKLVPQDPDDEPVSELLERIEQPKTLLPPIEAPTAPFAAPNGWTWVRLGNLANVVSGVTLGRNLVNYETVSLPYLRVANVQRGYLDLAEIKMVDVKIDEKDKYLLRDGDLLLTEGGDSDKLGRAAIWRDQISVCIHQNHIFRARPLGAASAEWLMLCTNSPYGRDYFESSSKKTTNLASINSTQLKNCPIALPPIAEQQRILAKVDELFAQTRALEARLRQAQADIVTANRAALHRLHSAQDDDQFQAAWRTLRDHFDVLYDDPRNVAELRQSILDLAVRGELVAQDPNDEPAEELLRRTNVPTVRKSEATKPRQAPTVLPNIPAGWTLVSSSAVCLSINDGDHLPPPKSETGIPFLVISNIRMGKLDFRNTRFVPQEYYDMLRDERKPRQGDVLYSIVGSLGTAVLIEDDIQFCFQRHMALLRPSAAIESKYLFYLLQAPVMLQQARATATGIAQLTIPMSGLRSLVFPLPPLAEQRRIVAKVDQLMRLCDALEAGLARAEAQRRKLAAAVLRAG